MKTFFPVQWFRRNPPRLKQTLAETPPTPGKLAVEGAEERGWDSRAILLGLMLPTLMVVFNDSMFTVALPAIRSNFDAQADLVAWIATGYSLSYVILMPLYGRLGDGLGKRKLFLAGITTFLIGACISLLSPDLRFLMMGRVIQGAGASAIIPLAIAIISELFPISQRGKALGTWNSIGPVARIAGPLVAGLLIVVWGWRVIFGLPLVVGLLAPFIVRRCIPPILGNAQSDFLRGFDWGGVALFGTAVTTILFFISSRPITGVESLRDWRLLVIASLLISSFILWERRRSNPFISFGIFSHKLLTRASLCAGLRMFMMSGIGFLLPLYLTDVRELSAAWIGVILVIHSSALLVTMRLGGQLADRWGSSRWPVVLGISMQVGAMVTFASLPGTTAWLPVVMALATHGLGAGLTLAALHRAAMGQVPQTQMGVAAGLYSMIRFFGIVLGTTLNGVLLQQGVDQGLPTVEAYQRVYWFLTGVGFLGVVIGFTLRE